MSRPLLDLLALFLRLGATAFGGPAAHIAMMEDEVVRRRRFLSRDEFLDLLGATNLIPGPNSTEMAIHIGYRRAGVPGLLVAGAAFILPAALATSALAWLYVRFGSLPDAGALLDGIKPVIIAIVLQALVRLGRSAVRGPLLGAVAAGGLVASLCGVHELLVLALGGLVAAAWQVARRQAGRGAGAGLLLVPGWGGAAAAAGAVVPFGLGALFLFFLKVGAVLFGSGYVLLAFLRADLVDHWRWLSEAQLLDAVAVGQLTPGPVFTTATFIGYVLAGPRGAAVATAGIFLPAFVFVALSGPLVPRIRRSPLAGAVLDGVNAASLALMAAVTWHLGRSAIHGVATALIAVAAAGALWLLPRVNSVWLVLGGAAVGIGMLRAGG